MWPMSNALYPGLGNTTDRPLTADSWKSHRGNPFAKAGSTHTRSRRSSRRLSFPRPTGTTGGRSSEDSGDGVEHLRTLLRRSQDALNTLAVRSSNEDVTGQPGPSDENGRHRRNSYQTFGSNADSERWQDPMWKTLSRQSSALASSTDDTSGDQVVTQPVSTQESSQSTPDVQSRPAETDVTESSRLETQPVAVEEQGQVADVSSDVSPNVDSPSGSSHGDDFGDQQSHTLVRTDTALSRSMLSSAGDQSHGHDFELDRHTDSESRQSSQGEKAQDVCRKSATMATAASVTADEASDDDSHECAPSLYDEKLQEAIASKEKPKRQEKVVKFDKIDEKTIDSSSLSGDPEKAEVDHQTPATPEPTGMYGLPLFALTAALSMAVFLVAMDVNVIATAVPHITGEFRSLEDVGWYGSAFLMTTCGFQVLFGRIYTIYPAKWVFVSAILVFLIGSLVAALSPSSTIFIVGRAIQGMGTSGILSGGLIIIAQVVPLQMRSFIGGAIGAMEGVAMISAPVLGGVLTDKLNWRWCFYINLPIGGFVLIVVFLFLRIPESSRPQAAKKATFMQTLYQLDVIGAALLMPPIVCLLLALQDGGTGQSWGKPRVVGLLVASTVLFAVFAYSQHRNADVAMIPFRLIKQRSVLSGFWYILCTSSALVIMTYFLPMWFQVVKGATPIQSGVGLLPMLLGVIFCVIISGFMVSWFGYYTPFMLLGTVLMSIGAGLLTTITPDTPKVLIVLYPVLFGAGIGVGFQQPIIGCQAALPKEDIPVGTSIIVFGQTIGAAVVLSAGDSVFQTQLTANIKEYMGISLENSAQILQTGPDSIASKLDPDLLPVLIAAVNKTMSQVFYVSLAMAVLSVFGALGMEWRSVKNPNKEKSKDTMRSRISSCLL
ncbi:Major Facilitator Superfamily protein [Apiospora rasikravindrae]|uniref:Major Facilitator Superfamily protein n=1 Tax=Apiospora rasikravindrae TaxID=990691 RepID=A0ABR1RYK5_9PEZI